MSKKKDRQTLLILGLIGLIIIVLFAISQCDGITINIPDFGFGTSQGIPGQSGAENPPDTSEDDEEPCNWEVIDSGHYMILSGLRTEWQTSLPRGYFRFGWDCTYAVNTAIIKEFASVDYIPNSAGGMRSFESTQERWGMSIANPNIWHTDCDLELQQWLCPGDPRNFNPNMFSSPYQEEWWADPNCAGWCLDHGFYGGFHMEQSGSTPDDCEEFGDSVQGACCCLEQQIPI